MAASKSASAFKDILSQVKNPEPEAEASPTPPAATRKPRRATTAAKSEAAPQGRRSGKSSDPAYTQATLYIRKDTHHKVKLKLLSMQQDKDMSDLAEELFSKWLDQKI